MKTKKIITGIMVIGMIWAGGSISHAEDRFDHPRRGQYRAEQHYGYRGEGHSRWNNDMHQRNGRHMEHRDYHRGSHHHAYQDRDCAPPRHFRNERHVSHPRVRVVLTPFGIFPVIY